MFFKHNKKEGTDEDNIGTSDSDFENAINLYNEKKYEEACSFFEIVLENKQSDKKAQKYLLETYNILLKKYSLEKKYDLVSEYLEKLDRIRDVIRKNI